MHESWLEVVRILLLMIAIFLFFNTTLVAGLLVVLGYSPQTPVEDVLKEFGISCTGRQTHMKPEDIPRVEIPSSADGWLNWIPLATYITISACPVLFSMLNWDASLGLFLAVNGIFLMCSLGHYGTLGSMITQQKIARYETADFHQLHNDWAGRRLVSPRQQTELLEAGADLDWDDVVHAVVIPNYKEDIQTMRDTLAIISTSGIAKQQICIILAMEERELECSEKAEQLKFEFAYAFRAVHATFHPPDLPGETAGKASNSTWACQQLLQHLLPEARIDPCRVVVTIADADSHFHPQYFSALNFHFLHQDVGPDAPGRYATIWQPPILHYLNFVRVPPLVRTSALISSQGFLGVCGDPWLMGKFCYSTYSLSALLVKAAGGWDSDYISEDQHIALKCYFLTRGKTLLCPILLPVVNYIPEGTTFIETLKARVTQANRHALGISELVYILESIPIVLRSLEDCKSKSKFLLGSLARLYMAWTLHGVCILWPLGLFSMLLAANGKISSFSETETTMFYASGLLCALNPLWMGYEFTRLFYAIKDRLEDTQVHTFRWRYPGLSMICTILESAIWYPPVACVGCLVEWRAAIKVAFSRRFNFHYEVAQKRPWEVAPNDETNQRHEALE